MRPAQPHPFLILGLFAVSLLLGGCFRYENDPGEGGVTIGEARELDEIAADLDARAQAPGVTLGKMPNSNDAVSENAKSADSAEDMPSPITAPAATPSSPNEKQEKVQSTHPQLTPQQHNNPASKNLSSQTAQPAPAQQAAPHTPVK